MPDKIISHLHQIPIRFRSILVGIPIASAGVVSRDSFRTCVCFNSAMSENGIEVGPRSSPFSRRRRGFDCRVRIYYSRVQWAGGGLALRIFSSLPSASIGASPSRNPRLPLCRSRAKVTPSLPPRDVCDGTAHPRFTDLCLALEPELVKLLCFVVTQGVQFRCRAL